MQLDRAGWLSALGIGAPDAPRLVVVQSPWRHRDRGTPPGAPIEDLHETAIPGLHVGRWRGQPVLWGLAHGAPQAVEPVQVGGELGASAAVLVGTCGSLQPGIRTGDVVVGLSATIGEGASQYYGGHGTATGDAELAAAAGLALGARGLVVHPGRIVTMSALLTQDSALVGSWSKAGHLAIDLETSAVLSAATFYGMRATALLLVSDEPLGDHGWLDSLTGDDQKAASGARHAASRALLEVALEVGLASPARG